MTGFQFISTHSNPSTVLPHGSDSHSPITQELRQCGPLPIPTCSFVGDPGDVMGNSSIGSTSEHNSRKRKAGWETSWMRPEPITFGSSFAHSTNSFTPSVSAIVTATPSSMAQYQAHAIASQPTCSDVPSSLMSQLHAPFGPPLPTARGQECITREQTPVKSLPSPAPIMFVDCAAGLGVGSGVKLEKELKFAHPGKLSSNDSNNIKKGGKFLFVNHNTTQSDLPGDNRQSIRSFVMCRARRARLWSTSRKKDKSVDEPLCDGTRPVSTWPAPPTVIPKEKGGRAKRQKSAPSDPRDTVIPPNSTFSQSHHKSTLPTSVVPSLANFPISQTTSPVRWDTPNHMVTNHHNVPNALTPTSPSQTLRALSDRSLNSNPGHNFGPSSSYQIYHSSLPDPLQQRQFTFDPNQNYQTHPPKAHSSPRNTSFREQPSFPTPSIHSPTSQCQPNLSRTLLSDRRDTGNRIYPTEESTPSLSLGHNQNMASSDSSQTLNSSPSTNMIALRNRDPHAEATAHAFVSPGTPVSPCPNVNGQDSAIVLPWMILRSWIRSVRPTIPAHIDLLSTLPISLRPQDIRLLYIFAEVLSPISVPLAYSRPIQAYDQLSIPADYNGDKPLCALARSWISFAFSSKAFMFSLLCSIAVFDHLVEGKSDTHDIVYYHVNAVTAISEALATRQSQLADGSGGNDIEADNFHITIIGTVWQLLCIQEGVQSLPDLKDSLQALSFVESIEANESIRIGVAGEEHQDHVDFRRAHNDGYLRMLDLRGGIESLSSDSCLQAMLLWHQALHSVSALRPFSFLVPGSLVTSNSVALRGLNIFVMGESRHPFGPSSPLLFLTDLDPSLPNPLVAIAESTVYLTKSLNQWFEYNNSAPQAAIRQDAALELQVHVCKIVSSILNWMSFDAPALETHDFSEPAWMQVKNYNLKPRRRRADEVSTSITCDSRPSQYEVSSSSCSVITVPPASSFEMPPDDHLAVIAGMDFDRNFVRPSLHQLHKILCLSLLVFLTWNAESGNSVPQDSSVVHQEAFSKARALVEEIINMIAESSSRSSSNGYPSHPIPESSIGLNRKTFMVRPVSVDYPLPSCIVESNIVLWILTILAVTAPPSTTIDPLTNEQISACKRFHPLHQPYGRSMGGKETVLFSRATTIDQDIRSLTSAHLQDYSILDAVFPGDRPQEEESSDSFLLRVWRTSCLRLGIWTLDELKLRLFTPILPSIAATLAGNKVGLLYSIPNKAELDHRIMEYQCPLWIPHRMDHSLEHLWISFIEPALPDFVPRLRSA